LEFRELREDEIDITASYRGEDTNHVRGRAFGLKGVNTKRPRIYDQVIRTNPLAVRDIKLARELENVPHPCDNPPSLPTDAKDLTN